MVKDGKAKSRRISVCFRAVAEDDVACRSSCEPLFKLYHAFFLSMPLSGAFYLDVFGESLRDQLRSLDLSRSGGGP